MPTFQFFKKGSKIDELVGANPAKLKSIIEANKTPADVWNTTGGFVLGGGGSTGSFVPPKIAPAPTPDAAPAAPPARPAPTGPGRLLSDVAPQAPAGPQQQQHASGDDPARAAFVQSLAEMGFTQGQGERAYAATKGNLQQAVEWCLSHPDDGTGQAVGGGPEGDAGTPGDRPPADRVIPGERKYTQEEQDVLDDIYGDQGPQEGGLSASLGGGSAASKFPPELRILPGMTPEQQRFILDQRREYLRQQRAAEAAATVRVSEAERIRQSKEALEAKLENERLKKERERYEAARQKKFEEEERARVKALIEQDRLDRLKAVRV